MGSGCLFFIVLALCLGLASVYRVFVFSVWGAWLRGFVSRFAVRFEDSWQNVERYDSKIWSFAGISASRVVTFDLEQAVKSYMPKNESHS